MTHFQNVISLSNQNYIRRWNEPIKLDAAVAKRGKTWANSEAELESWHFADVVFPESEEGRISLNTVV